MSPRTKNNLMAAMKCDAFDSAKYSRFAARARMDDDWELAKAFQETAERDRTEHFAKEAQLAGLTGDSADNLRNAIQDERNELELFTEFARQAAEDGDVRIASLFEEVGKDRAERVTRFEAALGNIGVHGSTETIRG